MGELSCHAWLFRAFHSHPSISICMLFAFLHFSPFLFQIIPALQSRCTRFRFGPLETDQVRNRLQFVIKQEK